jgi:hypothetical protein
MLRVQMVPLLPLRVNQNGSPARARLLGMGTDGLIYDGEDHSILRGPCALAFIDRKCGATKQEFNLAFSGNSSGNDYVS